MDPINPDQAQGSGTASFCDYSPIEFLQNFRVNVAQPTHAVLDHGRLQNIFAVLTRCEDGRVVRWPSPPHREATP